MKQTSQPMPEQLQALAHFAKKHGRYLKRKLYDAWLSGRDAQEPDGGLLRQVRNQFAFEVACRVQASFPVIRGELFEAF